MAAKLDQAQPSRITPLARKVAELEASASASAEAHRRSSEHVRELREAADQRAHEAEVAAADTELENIRAEYRDRYPDLERAVHGLSGALETLERLRVREGQAARSRAALDSAEGGDRFRYRLLPTLHSVAAARPIADAEGFLRAHRPKGLPR